MALDKIGVNSLLAVNSWIGLINANMQGTSRTGFKPTRISLTDGLGQLYTTKTDLEIPPSTLTVQATSMEWGQGSIVNSESSSHFAIQGEGFFVLTDKAHRIYLTRDGEFHWDGEGYLTNSAGLRVLSNGQDFIRRDPTDVSDAFSPDGYSKELLRYGDKGLMLVSVANRDGLLMSQYGSTVFQLDGDLPLRLQNNFETTTDGLTFIYDDPDILAAVRDPGFVPFVAAPPPGYSSDFSIDFGVNGLMNFRDYNPLAGGPFPSATPLDFDPAINTIDDIVQAINNYGATVAGGRVTASYDDGQDRLIISNEQVAPGDNTHIVFGGANGQALREFFKFGFNKPSNPIDDLDADNALETVLRSFDDIDYSTQTGYDVLDIDPLNLIYNLTTPLATLARPVPTYFHDKNNAFVQSISLNGNAGMTIGEGRTTSEFEVEMDVKVSNDAGSQLVFAFGQKDAQNLSSGGFSLRYDPVSGTVEMWQQANGYDASANSVLIGTSTLPIIATQPSGGLGAVSTTRLAFRLDSDKIFSVSVNGTVVNFNLGGAGADIGGHLSIRNSFNELQIHSLNFDMKGKYNPMRAGDLFSVGIPNTASVEIKNAWQERQRSRVVQAALETSTASLTEYVPMLGLAQKVFAAISKIISTHNALVDDINTLFR